MARLRYVGDAKAKDVPLSGGSVTCPRMKWVDLVAEAKKAHIREEHAEIVARDLVKQDDWESEPHQRAAKTRAANAANDEEQA